MVQKWKYELLVLASNLVFKIKLETKNILTWYNMLLIKLGVNICRKHYRYDELLRLLKPIVYYVKIYINM